jgi:DNA repair protein RecN (Recombination protein N)
MLRYEVDELEKAQLKPEEDILLEENRKILENAEKIYSTLEFAYNLLYQGYENPSIIDSLNKIIDNFEGIMDFYNPMDGIMESLKNILYELEDMSSTVRNLRDSIDFDMGKLDTINTRLELLDRIKSKYNKSISELLSYKAQAVAELDKAFNIKEEISELRTELTSIKLNLSQSAVELHKKRKKSANDLEQSISKELKDLGMKNVKFKVDIKAKDDPNGIEVDGKKVYITEEGIDEIELCWH